MCWMLRSRGKNFKRFDVDKTFTLTTNEVYEALVVFLSSTDEQQSHSSVNGPSDRFGGAIIDDRFDKLTGHTKFNALSLRTTLAGMLGFDKPIEDKPKKSEAPLLQPRTQQPMLGRRFYEPTQAWLLAHAPVTNSFRKEISGGSINHRPYWNSHFQRPKQQRLPGMIPEKTWHSAQRQINHGRIAEVQAKAQLIAELPSSLFSTPGRAITPHLIRSPAAARPIGARTVLEGVIHRRACQRGVAQNNMLQLEPEPVREEQLVGMARSVVRSHSKASAFTSAELAKQAKFKSNGLMPVGLCNTVKQVHRTVPHLNGKQAPHTHLGTYVLSHPRKLQK